MERILWSVGWVSDWWWSDGVVWLLVEWLEMGTYYNGKSGSGREMERQWKLNYGELEGE